MKHSALLEKAKADLVDDYVRSITTQADQHTKQLEKMEKIAEQIELIEEAVGRTLVTSSWALRYCNDIKVEKSELPAIRNVVGRLTVDGKMVACDFDKTGDVVVTLKPIRSEFEHLRFCYRTKHRPGKCRVETHTSTYRTLVCEA